MGLVRRGHTAGDVQWLLLTMLEAKVAPDLVSVCWQALATILLYPFADRLIDRFEDADVRFR